MNNSCYDVVVVGGGAVGLGAAYEVAKSGKSVLVLEKYNLYNQAGSSGDLARMYRTMYTEDFMADLAYDSLDIWDQLEKDAGTSLRSMTGLLNFGDPKLGEKTAEGTLLGPIDNLKRKDMIFKHYKHKEDIEKKWPFKNLPSNFEGVFAPDNGVINVPLLLRTLSRLAKDYGAHSKQNIEVTKLVPVDEKGEKIWTVEARKDDGSTIKYQARKIIITAGAYTNHITVPSFNLRLDLRIWEMVASYFSVNAGPNGTVFPSMWFQFEKDKGEGKDAISQLFYGFPVLEWGPPNVCRIAVDAASNKITDPNNRSSSVISPKDIESVQEFVKNHVVGVDSVVPAYSLTCLMTNVFDNMFVLDYVPEKYLNGGAKDSVAIFTAGWAMKFVPLLGRALKEMVIDGGSHFKYPEFGIMRKSTDGKESIIIEGDPSEPHTLTAEISSFSIAEEEGQASGSPVDGGLKKNILFVLGVTSASLYAWSH